MDIVRPLLPADTRAWLYAKIGAGDHADAIVDMLRYYDRADAELPLDIVEQVEQWLHGYAGIDEESKLRDLVNRRR